MQVWLPGVYHTTTGQRQELSMYRSERGVRRSVRFEQRTGPWEPLGGFGRARAHIGL